MGWARPSSGCPKGDGRSRALHDPATGQFLSVDPDVTATQQPYELHENDNPPTVVDPTGDFGTLQSCPAGVKTGNGARYLGLSGCCHTNNGSVVLIREGFVDKNGKGFGRVKIVQKHNVYMQTVANVVATTPREDIVHRGDSDEYESCVGFDGTPLPGGECVFVVVLLTKDPEGNSMAVAHLGARPVRV